MKTRNRIPLAVLAALVLATTARSATVAYWRFEGTDFLSDSAGGNTLTNNGSVTQVATTFSNPVPQTNAANANAASFNGTNYLTATDNAAFTSSQFTLEAFFSPASIGTGTRVIAGHFGSGAPYAGQRSYALVMLNTGELRAYVSPDGAAPAQFAATTLTAGQHYYAAMAVDVTDTGSSAVTIYLQDLSSSDLQVFNSNTTASSTAVFDAAAPFAIGATAQGTAQWVGTIDEVRFSDVKLAESQLLIVPEPSAAFLGGLGLCVLLRRRR